MPDQIVLVEITAEEQHEAISYFQTVRPLYRFAPYILFAVLFGLIAYLRGAAVGIYWFGFTQLIAS